jgi:peptidoglycan/xylan/chitin deacetylase (PgdA/CDA1 family)
VPRGPEARRRRRNRRKPYKPPRVRTRTSWPAHHRSGALGAAALGALGANALPALAPLLPRLPAALRIRSRLDDSSGFAITFDDGPDPHGTPAVLEVLERAGVAATFFLVGEQVRREPSLAAEIAAAGHGVQLHGERHRNQLRLTVGQIRDDLRRGEQAVRLATGLATRFYRPPFGTFSAVGLGAVRRSGWEPVLWSRWGRDWRADATGDSVASNATRALRGGEIVLLHDADHYGDPGCWRATAAALPRIIDLARGKGLTPVSLAPRTP